MEKTAWKVCKYEVIFGPYFSVFGLNSDSFRIQSEYIRIHLVFTITKWYNNTFGFYDNPRLGCVESLWTQIKYLKIKPNEKGSHTNESIMFKLFFPQRFFKLRKYIWRAIKNFCLFLSFLSLQLNKFLQQI